MASRNPFRGFDNSYIEKMQNEAWIVENRARAEFGVPGMFRISKEGKLYLTPRFLHMIGYRVTRDLTQIAIEAAEGGARGVADGVQALAIGLKHASAGDKKIQLAANNRIAVAMRQSLQEAYGRSIGRRQQVPSYRVGRGRYSGGALRRALQSRDMVVATNDTIQYINQDRLNVEARHWARLNFGVAPASTPPSFSGALKFAGTTIGTVGFRVQPRPPMFLPAGFWEFIGGKISSGPLVQRTNRDPQSANFGKPIFHTRTVKKARVPIPGGGTFSGYGTEKLYPTLIHSQPEHNKRRGWRENYGSYTKTGIRVSRQGFFPLAGAPRYPTRGIVGVNYLDAGLKTLVRRFPEEYSDMVDQWIQAAEGEGFQSGRAGSSAALVYRAYAAKPHGAYAPKTDEHIVAGYGFNAGREFRSK